MKIFLSLCLLIGTSSLVRAQGSVESMVAEWERAKAYTQAYLDAMPEEGYAFKPTAETRSFADQMLHLTEANFGFAAAATETHAPVGQGELEKTEDKSKARVITLVNTGYDFVIDALKKMTPEQLQESITLFGQFEMTREAAFRKCFEHQTHHRGQTTIYLRLSGVTPPQEMLF